MSYNLNNLFDAQDDVGKDDKAYLPIKLKNNDDHIMGCLQVNNSKWRNECLFLDWNEEVVQKKISNISDLLISMSESQPDIIAIQEIENLNVLRMLFKKIEALCSQLIFAHFFLAFIAASIASRTSFSLP